MTSAPPGAPAPPMPPPAEDRRAALLDQLAYLRDELALLPGLLPRLSRPLLVERPRPDTPSFVETIGAIARADAARLGALGQPAPAWPDDADEVTGPLARFDAGRLALVDALARADWSAPLPSGEPIEAFARRAVLDDAEALRTIGAFLFEAQRT